MKEIQKHRVGEIVYHRGSNTYMVITDVIYSTAAGYTYYLGYVPEPERRYNPLRSFNTGGYSEIIFEGVFEMCLNL